MGKSPDQTRHQTCQLDRAIGQLQLDDRVPVNRRTAALEVGEFRFGINGSARTHNSSDCSWRVNNIRNFIVY